MPDREHILKQALALLPEDRAYLAGRLLASIAQETAFVTELRRRSVAYRAGTTAARLAADVMEDLRRRQSEE